MTPPPHQAPSRLANGILLINLDHRPERLRRFAGLAAALPSMTGWQRLAAVNGMELPGFGVPPWFRNRSRDKCWAGRAGCTLSHRKAIEYARDQDWDRVLILEDDVLPSPDFEAHLADLSARWNSVPAWDVCYLGFTQPVAPCLKVAELANHRALYQLFGCATTHAYLVNRKAYSWLLDRLPNERTVWAWVARHRAIDRWYARHLGQRFTVVAVAPSLCGQDSDFSDIGQREAGNARAQEFFQQFPTSMLAGNRRRFEILRMLKRLAVVLEGWFDALRAVGKRRWGL